MKLPARLGEFELTDLLGEGGTGEVYAAAHQSGAVVALKILRRDLALTDRERRKFLEEAAKMRRVTHPSIVPVLEAGTLPDGRPFLSMPRLDGETLAARVRRGPLEQKTAFRIFAELGDAVATLHRADLVHRDIKPENIFVTSGPNARAVLLDLGIARDVNAKSSTTTEEGRMRGTPAYMAPERFFGSPANVQTDLYELAVVLYLMLTGNLPWTEEAGASGRLHPVHPDSWGSKHPGPVSTALLRALSTRPEVRPRNAEDFVAEIERARATADANDDLATRATHRVTLATAVAPAEVTTRPRRQRRTLAWVGAAFTIATATAVGLATRTPTPSSPLSSLTSSSSSPVPVPVPVPDLALTAPAPALSAAAADAAPIAPASARGRGAIPSPLRPRPAPSARPNSTEELYLDRQ